MTAVVNELNALSVSPKLKRPTISERYAAQSVLPECSIDSSTDLWNVSTIAGMTRTVAKLEVQLADVDHAAHLAAQNLEKEIDSMILKAAGRFGFSTTDILTMGSQVSALQRYTRTGSKDDLRAAFGSSRLKMVIDQEGIEEESTYDVSAVVAA